MLAIRMQRTGRKGHAMFRVVVQDSRRTPTSGKIVARLGSYDPHAKTITLDKEKAGFYLEHGAQPSERVAYLLKQEGVKLPEWVKTSSGKKRDVRNADKRRSTRPEEPAAETAPAEDGTAETVAETPEPAETPAAEEQTAAETQETSAEEPKTADSSSEVSDEAEAPAEESAGSDAEKSAAAESDEAADGDKPADKKA